MYKIAIWGTGLIYNRYINAVKLHEIRGGIRGIFITGKENLYDCLDGYKYVAPQQLKAENIDYIVVATEAYFEEVAEEAKQLGFDREHIFPIRIFSIPCFDLNNYVKLLHSHISIFSNSCWGGITYHLLGLKFRSPLINMFEPEEDYLKLISAPQHYFSMELKFDRWGNNAGGDYPICKLDDITLHFNHYHNRSLSELEEKWYDRISRINYDNVFAMMYTENKSLLEKFVKLPYTKKVCFVPFESSYQCSSTLRNADKKSDEPFWRIVNSIPQGKHNDYDVISMLNSGLPNHSRVICDYS